MAGRALIFSFFTIRDGLDAQLFLGYNVEVINRPERLHDSGNLIQKTQTQEELIHREKDRFGIAAGFHTASSSLVCADCGSHSAAARHR
jgi:hypothetical protein